jgi:hypothetical protein
MSRGSTHGYNASPMPQSATTSGNGNGNGHHAEGVGSV